MTNTKVNLEVMRFGGVNFVKRWRKFGRRVEGESVVGLGEEKSVFCLLKNQPYISICTPTNHTYTPHVHNASHKDPNAILTSH